jgi:hypothetical protein
VANVHLDGARAENELARNLPIGLPDRHEAQDLELAPRQPATLERARSVAAEPLLDVLSLGLYLGGHQGSQRLTQAGATMVETKQGTNLAFTIMRDLEGEPFCVG